MNNNTPTNSAQPIRSPLLTAEQAAEYLSIGISTVNRYRREGRIKATYISSDARYHIDDLDAFIEAARNCKGPAV
ncbi:MAG: helix-turn-helix domain-containing protein [Actinomycetota bacterium]|nr:helix-turn-helix domain-containing protein [Actinomycetota bacterium]